MSEMIMIPVLYWTNTLLVGFHSASLFIKLSVGRRVILLGHIIRIPSPTVFALFP